MRKRLLVFASIVSLPLLSCAKESIKTYSNPLIRDEVNQIIEDARKRGNALTSSKIVRYDSYDESALYPKYNSSSSINVDLHRMKTEWSSDSQFFANHVIKTSYSFSSTGYNQNISSVYNDYSVSESIYAALPNPSSKTDDQEYGLYLKTTAKNRDSSYYGSTLSVVSSSFATASTLDEKFNDLISSDYLELRSVIPTNRAFSDGGSVKIIDLNYGWYMKTNYLLQNSKPVPILSQSSINALIEKKNDGKYYYESYEKDYKSVAFSDYLGNKLETTTGKGNWSERYNYGDRGTMDPGFSAEEAIAESNRIPVLSVYVEDESNPGNYVAKRSSFGQDKSIPYQQAHGKGHEYTVGIYYRSDEMKGLNRYTLSSKKATDEGSSPDYLPSSFKMEEGLTLITYGNEYFDVVETGSSPSVHPAVTISIIFDDNYENQSISITKVKGN